VKIVQAAGWYHPDSLGGTEVYVEALARRLRQAGHDVRVAAPDPQAGPREYTHARIPVFRYPIPAAPTRDEAQSEVPARGAEEFHAWLAEVRPDVVHFHTFVTGLGPFEVTAARAAGARTVATTHSSSLGWICQRGTLMRWGTAPCDGLCRRARCAACELQHRGLPRPLAAAVGAVPHALSRRLGGLPGRAGTALGLSALIERNRERQRRVIDTLDRFVVLTGWALEAVAANGFPREKLALNRLGHGHTGAGRKPGPDERPTALPLTVGYLGRFDRIKGICDLVAAVASMPAGVPVRLELRGPVQSDSERALLAELHALAGGDPRIVFAPAVPPDRVLEILAGYDLLACPSLCHEGGPTVAIEAHAVGTPVVGSRIGGLEELVTDGVTGRLMPPGDRAVLTAILRQAAEDPTGTVDRWRRALPSTRTMDEVTADYLSLYHALTTREKGAA
jgi:glycosyltransferase involved in cell wall biosynthesis